jgi:hypothetical protein
VLTIKRGLNVPDCNAGDAAADSLFFRADGAYNGRLFRPRLVVMPAQRDAHAASAQGANRLLRCPAQ